MPRQIFFIIGGYIFTLIKSHQRCGLSYSDMKNTPLPTQCTNQCRLNETSHIRFNFQFSCELMQMVERLNCLSYFSFKPSID